MNKNIGNKIIMLLQLALLRGLVIQNVAKIYLYLATEWDRIAYLDHENTGDQ